MTPSPKFDREISAASIRHGSMTSLRFVHGEYPPCPYPAHREHYWRLADNAGPPQCGVCHPPAPGLKLA